MEKSRWLDFLSSRLRVQISLENVQKAEAWGFALLGLLTLGGALAALAGFRSEMLTAQTKVLFLLIFYLVMVFGVHTVGLLQRGEKPMARLLGVQDFTGLLAVSSAVIFYSLIVLVVSHQAALESEAMGGSKFFGFMAWVNDLAALIQFVGCLLFVSGLFFLPKMLAGWVERGRKLRFSLLGTHAALFVFLGFGYLEMVPLGSPDFFEEFRAAGLFWIFIGASLILIGKLLRPLAVPPLASLELEIASGRLEHPEDILARLKEAFISRRLLAWLSRLSHSLASETAKIAAYSHEAIKLVGPELPSEIDLNQVEDRYRRAEALARRLERENQRFLVGVWFFDLSDSARLPVEELREQFSRELRNIKIEIASVRKRIDERLISLKSRQWPSVPPATVPTPTPSEAAPTPLKV